MKRIIANICLIFLVLVSSSALGANFSQAPISKIVRQEMIADGLWKKSCPVPLDRLTMLNISYYDFEGKSHDDGQMIVMDAAAPHILNSFKKIYEQKFPLRSIKLTSEYGGDDNLSMADNNTSAFNCREVTGGGAVSVHAYGLAIDINPLINPYLKPVDKEKGKVIVLPPAGSDYLNRFNSRPGMVEPIVSIFEKNGLPVWGGSWNSRIDWQHFQTSRALARLLAIMRPEDAVKMFELYVKYHKMLTRISYQEEGAELLTLYKQDSKRFLKILSKHIARLDSKEPKAAMLFIKKQMTN